MKDCHPLVSFLYFCLVIGFALALSHPACLAVSLLCAFSWSVSLGGRTALRRNALIFLPMMLLAGLMNPLFSHQGVTILAYFPSGNPLTLESIWYGLFAAALLLTVVLWFSCWNRVMTAEKLVWLFGRLAPALSLMLAMALRFLPRLFAHAKEIAAAQRGIGRDTGSGGVLTRLRHGLRILSILVTWSLENAIETADSMKSRGYGLPGRTAFSRYRWGERDRDLLAGELGLGAFLALLAGKGALFWRYYPRIQGAQPDAWFFCALLANALLCGLPLWLERREDRIWRRLQAGKDSE